MNHECLPHFSVIMASHIMAQPPIAALQRLSLDADPASASKAAVPLESENPQLQSLPSVVIDNIIVFLDTMSLIDFSQTCQNFRQAVRPTKSDLVQRLLSLELLEEHGGSIAHFNSDGALFAPARTGAFWVKARYACSGCLKLLSHMQFDNHSMYRMEMRKPTVASNDIPLRGPEPGNSKQATVRYYTIRDQKRKDLHSWHATYQDARHRGDAELMDEAERHIVGQSRADRLCNECRWKRGFWKRNTTSNRSRVAGVPMITSRQISLPTRTERYFPGLFAALNPSTSDPRLFRVYREDAKGDLYSLYSARCPRCNLWYETSDFLMIHDKIAETNGDRSEIPCPDMVCNNCLVTANPSTFKEIAKPLLLQEVQADLGLVDYQFKFGWRILHMDMRQVPLNRDRFWGESIELKKTLLYGLKWDNTNMYGPGQKMINIEKNDLDDLRKRAAKFRAFCDGLSASDREQVLQNTWFKVWVEDYELLEHKWQALRAILNEVEAEGIDARLCDWVRDRQVRPDGRK